MNVAKGVKYLLNADYRFALEAMKGKHRDVDDREYLERMYHGLLGKRLDLEHPQTFNEKLQWMKLYDRNDLYTAIVDKCEAKDFVANIIGKEYIIPNYGVWETAEAIDFQALPEQFVLKTTHDSGGVVICKDKKTLDINAAKAKLTKSLKHDYYSKFREWPYKNIHPRIIAEQYLAEADAGVADYKFHCFHGEPKVVLVCTDRFASDGLKEDFFDMDWNHLPIRRPQHGNAAVAPKRPSQLEQMISIAKRLSAGFPFLRVDLYEVGNKVYFGELTLFPASGLRAFIPSKWDEIMGSWIQLDKR